MSRGKVGYAFKPGHAKMPTKWRPLSFHKRAIMRELWLMSENGFLDTELRYLVRDLDPPSKADRSNLTMGVDQLIKAGFITADEKGVWLHTEPVGLAMDLPSVSIGLAVDLPEVPTSVNPTKAKSRKLLNSDLTDQIEEKRSDQTETRAREAPAPKPIPVAAAGASSLGSLLPALRVVPEPTERERSPEITGFLFVASLLGRSAFDVAPVGSWRSEYAYIGSRPAGELERVANVVNTTEWCQLNPSRVDAKHLQKYWQKYLDGPPKPVLVKDPEAEAIRRKRAENYAAQRETDRVREARIAAEAVSEEETRAHARAAMSMLLRKVKPDETLLAAGAAE